MPNWLYSPIIIYAIPIIIIIVDFLLIKKNPWANKHKIGVIAISIIVGIIGLLALTFFRGMFC
ncbi:MAG: hypothetical protein GF329_14895 [Candidatus Lokiarchaeota archaeon]|nr:hypothetical protein [Candidatus Lokiarchaeota archaeon]